MSQTTSKYARDELDFYVEPAWCVECLLDNEVFTGTCLDPACGLQTIPKALNARAMPYKVSDINPGMGLSIAYDFINDDPANFVAENIICNPPFRHAVPFIRRALGVATNKVAMLLPLSFPRQPEAQGRDIRSAPPGPRVRAFP